MANESLIVTATNGTTDSTFYRVSGTGYASRWADASNTVSSKQFIDIDHEINPTGSLKPDLHKITLRREEVNSTTGVLNTSSISLQIKVAKDAVFTSAVISDMLSKIMCLFNKSFMDTFQSGLTPSGDFNVTGPFNPDRD